MKLFAFHPAALWLAGLLLGAVAASVILSGRRQQSRLNQAGELA